MSTFANNNVQQIIVGGTADKTASGSLADANAGEIVVVNAHGGAILTEATAADATHFQVGVRTSDRDVDIISDVIEKSKVKSANAKLYAAATEQITYIGYDGTTGSIPENDNELYYVRLYMEDLFARGSGDGKRVKQGVYRAGTSTTQELIAREVTKSLIRNFSREAERQVKFERVCNDAASNTELGGLTAATGNLTVTYGSKYVSAATDATGGGDISVGDWIRIGTSATEALTDPIYEVVAIDAANDILTLDVPYQGDSGVIDDDFAHLVANADAASADWGLKLSGLAADFSKGKIKYKKVRWETQVDTTEGFGDGVNINNAQAATAGTGTVEIIGELEWFNVGNQGEFFRMGEPNIFDPTLLTDTSVAGGGYDMIDITFVNDEVVGFQPNVSPKHLVLAIPATTPAYADGSGGGANTADDITDVLEVLCFGAAGGELALI